ncbi:Protein CBG13779 [Caenorhabditis briggsae]|uniref:Protein CBG13779 n=1 Tax=Caenorhabditis briggsae TaxID=6238 RepID=A8XIP2_CAEBR|nr:Protein CBG13779 [Caenorhabditis briggsae]CAP32517.1 Protein CBG13779 [Caenorhabditis briggsae]
MSKQLAIVKIHKSCTLESKNKFKRCDQECECSDDSCPNVCERKECPETCSSNKMYGCQNQKFRGYGIGKNKKSKNGKEPEPTKPSVEIRETRGKGRGLYATKFIQTGDFVIPFTGEYISEEEKRRRFEIYGAKMMDAYVLDSGNHTIDVRSLGIRQIPVTSNANVEAGIAVGWLARRRMSGQMENSRKMDQRRGRWRLKLI